jgi:predicted transcriptional regulator
VKARREAMLKLRMTVELKARVDRLAEARGEGVSVIVREALRAYLAAQTQPLPQVGARELQPTGTEGAS